MNSFNFNKKIFNISSVNSFNETALEIFRYQYRNNSIYREFTDRLAIKINEIKHYLQIPFLPIEFFKNYEINTVNSKPSLVFLSSGTTGSIKSKHYIVDVKVYEESFRRCFEIFYGNVSNYCILALLSSYLERKNSSLVYMIKDLIERSGNPDSGFYLNNYNELIDKLNRLKNSGKKVILFGVTFALLDIAGKYSLDFPDLIVIETGGMKGRRKEIIREELHEILCRGFGVKTIHSEYGMTELLSQAYSKGKGIFKTPQWMKILIRDINDPLTIIGNYKSGGINVIDLANYYSCSFIATQDLGKLHKDGSFEVLGRFDTSDIR
ncbi:MAG: acyl transferase, partial [Bacteroidetes bacterium]|nr:acyl transferase [Bacteroidota bacterium]